MSREEEEVEEVVVVVVEVEVHIFELFHKMEEDAWAGEALANFSLPHE